MATPKKLCDPAQLTTSYLGSGGYYRSAAGIITKIGAMTLTNSTTGTVLAFVSLVKFGGSASASNTVAYEIVVPPKESVPVFGAIGHVLNPGDFIDARADTGTAVAFHASGSTYPTE